MLAQDHMFSHYGVIITPPFLQCIEKEDAIIMHWKSENPVFQRNKQKQATSAIL